jgi:polyisoprenoid-binding protein YceI
MSPSSAIATPDAATTSTTTWNLDPAHARAEFKVRHMMISYTRGEFSGLSGVLNLDESDYTKSSVEASIPAASLRTVDDKRDAHLKNADFFDVEKFPTLTFRSTNIESMGGRNYAVTGDLTIHGVTKSVVLAVGDVSEPSIDPTGKKRIGLSGSTKIHRKDFGLTWNVALELGGVLIGDEVTITLDLEFIKG